MELTKYSIDELKQALAARELDAKKSQAANEGATKKKLAAFLKKYKKEIDRYIRKPPPISIWYGADVKLPVSLFSWFDSDDTPIYQISEEEPISVKTLDRKRDSLFKLLSEDFSAGSVAEALDKAAQKQIQKNLGEFAEEAKGFLAICIQFNEEVTDSPYEMMQVLKNGFIDYN